MNDEVKKLKCGLVMPISTIDGCPADHWVEVKEVIEEALSDTVFDVQLVSDSDESGIIQKRIVQNIYENDIIICDVSAKNPNVMFELGMRLAFDKPAIIIKDDKTNYSFDTGSIEHLAYPRDLHYRTIQEFKIKLKSRVIATYEASLKSDYTTFLKHFGQFVVAKIDAKPVGKEEYIITAINELRSEVSMLAKLVRTREDRPMNKLAELSQGYGISPLTVGIPEVDFIKNYFKQTGSHFTVEEATTTKSLAFDKLCEAYAMKYLPGGLLSNKKINSKIQKELLDALQLLELI